MGGESARDQAQFEKLGENKLEAKLLRMQVLNIGESNDGALKDWTECGEGSCSAPRAVLCCGTTNCCRW